VSPDIEFIKKKRKNYSIHYGDVAENNYGLGGPSAAAFAASALACASSALLNRNLNMPNSCDARYLTAPRLSSTVALR
jgi:hypothetical protein